MESAYLDCQDSDGFGHERGGGPGPFPDAQAFCPRHLVVERLSKKHPVRHWSTFSTILTTTPRLSVQARLFRMPPRGGPRNKAKPQVDVELLTNTLETYVKEVGLSAAFDLGPYTAGHDKTQAASAKVQARCGQQYAALQVPGLEGQLG